ncbi:MAG TPA: ParB/RepB/Spo0J family partition protein [Bacteroidota bacterium]
MSKGKQVLGRGLASLIPRPIQPIQAPSPTRQDDGVTDQIIAGIDINKIHMNPYQPRADFDPVALDELRRSIQEKGIIQPITVGRTEDGYQLISGERRVRAAREAGLAQIPAYIIRIASNEEMLELALIENLQREHLNPIEIAISYKRLLEECSLTQEQVSDRIGKDRSTVTNSLRLLRLPEAIQMSLRKGELSAGHARALLSIEDSKVQNQIFAKVREKGISVREVERLARESGKGKKKALRLQASLGYHDSAMSAIEERLRQRLGTKVQLKQMTDGKGEIIVEYYSGDDLERILDLLTADVVH